MRTYIATATALLAGAVFAGMHAAPKQPVYIGVEACATCHADAALGDQYGAWLRTKHSKAYAALLKPESKQIARISGSRQAPEKEPVCLGCHATAWYTEDWEKDDGFHIEAGMQCESCHGPGSEYATEAIMRDRKAAMAAGLRMPTKRECMGCHIEKPTHTQVLGTKPIDFEKGLKEIAHPLKHGAAYKGVPEPNALIDIAAEIKRLGEQPRAIAAIEEVQYKTPLNMAMRPDGRELYVACEGSDSVVVVDPATRRSLAEIKTGGNPADVTFSPDGKLAFVSNRHDDTVSVIDVASRSVVKTLPTGDEPHGVLTDKDGKNLYVLNASSDDITVYDVAKLERTKSLSAGRGPWSLALSPDGGSMAITSSQANFAFREPFHAELTLLEMERGVIDQRLKVPGANLMMGVDWHPSGEFALATLNRTKTLVPMTRLMQGWTINNGLAVIWRDGTVDEVLLDEPDLGFADATDLAFTKDGKYALVTSSGTNRVAVVDVAKLVAIIRASSKEKREKILPNHVGLPTEFVTKHLLVGRSPRGILVAGNKAYVADSLDDALTVIDLQRMAVEGQIDLGGPKTLTKARYGERLFHSANITFRKQYSCHTCHPDGHVDGLTYDIEADGIGVSPVDNRTLRGINDTAPFKWEGTNPSLQRQCGARLSVFFTRVQPFNPDELSAVDYYITTIARPANRHRSLGAPLTPAQRRGRALFMRTARNDGSVIPEENRCISCHFPPYYTDRQRHDVGTKHKWDRTGNFDVPHLNNIYDSAPYLHNGMAPTLEEIWTVYNPEDKHGVTNDMTKDQLNDLIEYIKTL